MKYYIGIAVFFILACANEKKVSDHYGWIEGKWQSEDGTSSENWNRISEQSYNGIGYSHKADTTSISEYLRLYVSDNQWNLEAKVIGRNKGKIITFLESNKSSKKSLILENVNHDFPKRIMYTYLDDDSIRVDLNKDLPNALTYMLFKVAQIKNLNLIE